MSLPNDQQRIAEALAKLEASNPSYSGSPKQAARRLIRRQVTIGGTVPSQLANGSNAVLANANPVFVPDVAGRVLKVSVVTDTAILAAGPGNATVALVPLYVANGFTNPATIATITSNTTANSGTGNVSVGIPFDVPVVLANARYAAGVPLAPQVSMNGTGVVTGKMSFTLTVEEEAPDTYPV